MSVRGWIGSLVFGAAAAITSVFVWTLSAPWLSVQATLILQGVTCTVAYVTLLADTPRHRLRNFALGSLGSLAVALLAGWAGGESEIVGRGLLALGLTGVVAFVRSGLEFEIPPMRAVAWEAGLGSLAIAFASALATVLVAPPPLCLAAAIWGYALVQSVFFLMPGCARARSAIVSGDRFDRAQERLEALLAEA